MAQRMITGAEMLAGYAVDRGCESALNAVEGFAALLMDDIYERNGNLVLTENEEAHLATKLRDFIENVLVEPADALIRDWAQSAREDYEVRREGERGQY